MMADEMSDSFPLDAVPSWLAPEQRRAFWDHVSQTNVMEMWRARDEFDEGVDPESVRGKVLALMDALDRVAAPFVGLDGEQVARDYADGAALRRLREALPEGAFYVVDSDDNPKGIYEVSVRRGERETTLALEYAATVAEAADKCREALEAR